MVYRKFLGPLIAFDRSSAEQIIKYSVRYLGAKMIITTEDKWDFLTSLGGRKLYECFRMRKGDKVNEDGSFIRYFQMDFRLNSDSLS
nr:hypothetical protein [Acidianus sp. HS-5]